jgi:hypothetical protein
MKIILFITCISLLFVSCDNFAFKKENNDEPPYKAKIAWDSGLYSNYFQSHTVDGDSVYFYERPPEYHAVNIYALTKLDAGKGTLIWRSRVLFRNIQFCQPYSKRWICLCISGAKYHYMF